MSRQGRRGRCARVAPSSFACAPRSCAAKPALFDEAHPHRPGLVRCFAVHVDGAAYAHLGSDPELHSDEQMLAAIAWRPLAELRADPQVGRVIAALR